MLRDRGSTLVEVLAAGAILSAVVLCLANFWVTFDRLSFDLVLRQKAALVLNGETERLVALYATTALGSQTSFALGTPSTSGYPALGNYDGSDDREVYRAATMGLELATSVSTFRTGSDAGVLMFGTGQAARNYVWLDRERALLAQLSWLECTIDRNTITDCWNGTLHGKKPKPKKGTPYTCYAFDGSNGVDNCRLIIVVLEYPFALTSGVPTSMSARTMTLSTIVGRRS